MHGHHFEFMNDNEIKAHQWFKNGDHPKDYDQVKANGWEGQIVRYYRRPDVDGQSVCPRCQQIMHDHGFIDEGEVGHTVCPGDWVVECRPGIFVPYKECIQAIRISRELADAIDRLIYLRIVQREANEESEVAKLAERIEIEKREIADALKLLDHRSGGVYQDDTERKMT